MAIKGNQRQDNEKKLYVGFANVKVVSINPTRKQMNTLVGKEDSDKDEEINYVDEFDGNQRVRIVIWLKEEGTGRLFIHSFNILNKERINLAGDKYQYINNVCSTGWADEESNLMDWFVNFTTKEKEVIGKKTYRKALVGEEELANFIRAWLNKLNFNNPATDVTISTKDLFAGKFKELQEQVDGDFVTPFVALFGVRTVVPKEGEEGEIKKYQAIYGKNFLQSQFIKFINNGNKMPNDYTKKQWSRFVEEVSGEYGANFYYELEPLTEYDAERDLIGSGEKLKDLTAEDSKY